MEGSPAALQQLACTCKCQLQAQLAVLASSASLASSTA